MRRDNIFFIGVHAGIIKDENFCSSFILNVNGKMFLIDAGDGVSFALIKNNLSPLEINSIVITHFHPDHASGLPFLINQMNMLNREEVLNIIMPQGMMISMKTALKLFYICEERLKFKLNYILCEFNSEITLGEDFSLIMLPNTHLDKHRAFYNISEPLESASLLFNVREKKVFFTGDIGGIEDLVSFNNNININADYIICELSHIIPDDALQAFKTRYSKLIFTHLPVEKEAEIYVWRDFLPNDIRDNVVIAKAGDIVSL